jgi:predicted nucleic acid-binding protein
VDKSLPEWLAVQEPARIDPSLRLGPGEAAAIALAEELNADWVLLDERKGSRKAESRGLRVAGTLTIIEEAAAKDLLDYAQARDRLVGEASASLSKKGATIDAITAARSDGRPRKQR